MPSSSPYVVDVTEQTFESEILNTPADMIILVDFWAPWCAPCRQLTPILEKLADEYNGRVKVAKINTDENPTLSMQFGIQGIPAVKIIQDGKLVHEFSGAIPETQVRQIIEEWVGSESDDIVGQGYAFLEQGDYEKAKQCFENALAIETDNHAAAVGLAKIALHEGDWKKAQELARSIEASEKEYDQAQGILNRIEFMQQCQEAGGKDFLLKRLESHADDLDARYALGCCFTAEENYRQALEEFLTIVKKDKKYKEEAGKKAMVKVFSIIGQRSPLADEYRDQLEWILY